MKCCNGKMVTPCSSFVYLGPLTNKGESGMEIRRRIIKAGEVCRSGKVWKMKGLSLKLKGGLFSAFVLSVLLYNSEVWVIGKRDEGSRREGCILHEEGGERDGEKRERGRATVKPTIEGDAWYGVDKKKVTKKKIAVGRS